MSNYIISDINTSVYNILNKALTDHNLSEQVSISFDSPGGDTQPDVNTLSVFLYDVQEDLELRQSTMTNLMNAQKRPKFVHIACKYLITYWQDASSSTNFHSSGPYSAPDSIYYDVFSVVLNALLNYRELEVSHASNTFPSFTRVIPPLELHDLGTFWQSLGDRPRLCLGYAITVPMPLEEIQSSAAVITGVNYAEIAQSSE